MSRWFGNEAQVLGMRPSWHVLQVSHQLGTLMDWFSTALDLAHVKEPSDRIIDGISLLPLFYNGTITNRSHRDDKVNGTQVMITVRIVTWLLTINLVPQYSALSSHAPLYTV